MKLHSVDEPADVPRLPIQTTQIQAHQGMEQIISGKATTMRHIAQALNMDPLLRGADASASEPCAGHRKGNLGKPPTGQSDAGQTRARTRFSKQLLFCKNVYFW